MRRLPATQPQTGAKSTARDLLAGVYGWFTEGFETRDLREAKALPQEMAVFVVIASAILDALKRALQT